MMQILLIVLLLTAFYIATCTAWTIPTHKPFHRHGAVLLDSRIPEVFPTSTRRAILLQKIQQQQQQEQVVLLLDEKDAKNDAANNNNSILSNSYYSYGQPGWSNRFGSVLTPAAIPGVYTADRPFFWNSIDVGCRMTVIELLPKENGGGGGGLFIHSPVALDGPLYKLLESWNQPVKYIVSPNYEHVKFANQWHQAFPEAQMWACPGLMERMPQITWTGEIPYGHRPSGFAEQFPTESSSTTKTNNDQVVKMEWEPDIQALHIDTEVNPFTGKPFFNECIFYHQPSHTLMTTDLYWNYPPRQRREDVDDDPDLIPPSAVPWTTFLWKFGMDEIFQPFYMQLMTRDKQRLDHIAHFLVEGWNVETLIPAHGDVVRGSDKVTSVLRQHFKMNK
jgi:hypothetical protein